jgi:hypothetical protein
MSAETAAVVGGLTALGAALYHRRFELEQLNECESALKLGRLTVLAHGTPDEIARAKSILNAPASSKSVKA